MNEPRVIFNLDESGSMGGVTQDAIDGYNYYLKQMRDQDIDVRFTLTLFEDTPRDICVDVPLSMAPDMTRAMYAPCAGTGLYDTLMRVCGHPNALAGPSLAPANQHLARLGVPVRAPANAVKNLVITLTDGEDTSSHTRFADLKKRVAQLKATGLWTFVFITAGPGAHRVAVDLGIEAGNTLDIQLGDLRDVFRTLADATIKFIEAGSQQTKEFFLLPEGTK